MAKDTSKGIETVEPTGLSEEKAAFLQRLGAACDCMCSQDQYAGARGAGKNSSTCGCYCALSNDSANSNGANSKRSTQMLNDVVGYLQDYS